MRLTIAAIGRLKKGPERDLIERYSGLLTAQGRSCGLGPLRIIELPETRGRPADQRREDEAERLLAATSDCGHRVLLDERGHAMTSNAIAGLVGKHRDVGKREIAFLIGGPDGHGNAAKTALKDTMTLSPFTLPHGLARIVLAEQLYRAVTILSGHPYHRE
ncbi:MAG: 23S rRNA (pseudouridine(1915)-N(3))-methyltransferase RlmH [Alphaproteobacteria bacterium]|nr:23S rRNA (pseudouridine(1915)-N(3))-methyltransferase RlmH [Alphaproteobacteria bacterium]